LALKREKVRIVPAERKVIPGGAGVLKLERVHVICPACGQQVEAVATDVRVKGYCAVAKQYVEFLVEAQLSRKKRWQDPEYRVRQSAAGKKLWQDPEYRAKVSAAIKKRWQDPEYRAKMRGKRGRKKKEELL